MEPLRRTVAAQAPSVCSIASVSPVSGPQNLACIIAEPRCPNANVVFRLYTREAQDQSYQLDVSHPETISSVRFSSGQPLKVLIHGYTGDGNFSPNIELRPAYLSRGYNVISVDYATLAPSPCYAQGVYNVPVIGNCTAQLLDVLVDAGAVALRDIHVIGFSLGGQVAGQVQAFLKSGRLPRVTGLDPAMPMFTDLREFSKLDSSDADFVDVIHTNAGSMGKMETCGHVDFYMNGGSRQPGCDETTGRPNRCSHDRAPEYFAESITSEVGFWGFSCANLLTYMSGWCTLEATDEKKLVIMGEHTPSCARGQYYVTTRARPPFARGKASSTGCT